MNNLIFIADNDLTSCQIIQTFLEKEGFAVKCFETGDALYEALEDSNCALAILNTTMSGSGGFIVGAKIRQISNIAIIMLAPQPSDDDYIFSVSLGIDAYLAKPICPTKLVGLVRALLLKTLLRTPALAEKALPELSYGDITLCSRKLMTLCNGKALNLTKTEFKMLEFMLANQDRAIPRAEMIGSIWGKDARVNIRAVDDVVKRLRQKMAEAESQAYVATIWGIGFKMATKGA